MSAVMNEAAAGFASRDARYGCVLKLVAPTDASEVECGHAVLVAPDLALTVAHCVKQWQRQLQLLCVLSGERAAVASVHWAGGVSHVYGDAARHFPQIPIDKFSDEIVVLRLAAPMRAACAEIELAPRQPAYAVQLAAADRRAGGQGGSGSRGGSSSRRAKPSSEVVAGRNSVVEALRAFSTLIKTQAEDQEKVSAA